MLELFEDFLDPLYAKRLEELMLSNAFPYYFFSDIDYGEHEADPYNFGFSHTFIDQFSESRSDFLDLVLPVAFEIADSVGLELTQLIRIRAVLLTPVSFSYNHKKHIDVKDIPDSLTAIYYVNDSDGPTTIYAGDDVFYVHPKHNSVVVFDTSMEHHGSKPMLSSSRIVLNVNFKGIPK